MGRIYQRTLHAKEEHWHSSAWLALLSDFEDIPRRKKVNILRHNVPRHCASNHHFYLI